ncbi:hypothetical protein SISSUDRAFT_1067836 [Sistotremastrum suecicum HHB10207 ss-3]|uniref:Uncharacterized protein n=1 Tax=Sistotremastrum suecicum HHB10207 ss-3 TaxID=1314776 RepID=A0A165WMT1_9AGAM|nr:hypothetical protein SISSUDRAFT_1067836 [Sistotremastrum suecicum HHB10207 ss-3]
MSSSANSTPLCYLALASAGIILMYGLLTVIRDGFYHLASVGQWKFEANEFDKTEVPVC